MAGDRSKRSAWLAAAACTVGLLGASGARAQASDCAVATDQAVAADVKAATTPHNGSNTTELVRLHDLAVAWWEQAVEFCQGRQKERAERNLADSRQVRNRFVDQHTDNAACTASHKDAGAMQLLAEQAVVERRWQDAALLFRKVESTWDLAAERCRGNQQRIAQQRREQAATDARNALSNTRERPVTAVVVPLAPAPASAPAASTLPAAASAPAPRVAAALPAGAKQVDLQMGGGARLLGLFAADPGGRTYTGRGKIIWPNGEVYDGAVVANQRQGLGEFVWQNGQRYNGEWVADRPEGTGTLRFANGNLYEGPVAAGEPQGTGKMVYQSGDVYIGQFTRGEPDGQGAYTWINGQRYDGAWVRGKANGRGVLNFANGNAYEGEVADGVPTGQGRMTFASGDTYRGQFAQGLPEGQGVYTWKNGDQYTGGWKAGQKQGQGTMLWRSGDRWEGIFQADAQTERGTLIRKSQ
ncbi:MAG: hypothetical protein HY855_13055 [Burkholderiales bacterium]|nr:hypothetical protein [Burkholderiales bacterium]